MTVTIKGLKHTEILRDRTDPRFTGRTLRLVSEFGGELKLELSARELVSLAALLDEAKNTLVFSKHCLVNADQVPSWEGVPA